MHISEISVRLSLDSVIEETIWLLGTETYNLPKTITYLFTKNLYSKSQTSRVSKVPANSAESNRSILHKLTHDKNDLLGLNRYIEIDICCWEPTIHFCIGLWVKMIVKQGIAFNASRPPVPQRVVPSQAPISNLPYLLFYGNEQMFRFSSTAVNLLTSSVLLCLFTSAVFPCSLVVQRSAFRKNPAAICLYLLRLKDMSLSVGHSGYA